MASLYVTEQGAIVKKVHRRLQVEKDGVKIAEIPVIKIDTILLYGGIQISTQAMAVLLNEGIEVSFMSVDGKLKGRLVPVKAKNIVLRMKQYERFHDIPFSLKIAKTIVRQKINHSLELIRLYRSNYPDEEVRRHQEMIEKQLFVLDRKTAIKSVLGVEGITTAYYFKSLRKMFRGELEFTGRTRRPPADEVNAMLSFGYVLFSNEITSHLEASGFDPYIGFLHGIDYGRPSLALDIIEEFRVPFVDRFVLTIANKKIIQKNDFTERDGGFYLTSDGLKTYLAEYEKYLSKPRKNGVSIRDAVKKQVQAMSESIRTGKEYVPYSG